MSSVTARPPTGIHGILSVLADVADQGTSTTASSPVSDSMPMLPSEE